jgi:hypothetical protein
MRKGQGLKQFVLDGSGKLNQFFLLGLYTKLNQKAGKQYEDKFFHSGFIKPIMSVTLQK